MTPREHREVTAAIVHWRAINRWTLTVNGEPARTFRPIRPLKVPRDRKSIERA
jgi:hypothetical protein